MGAAATLLYYSYPCYDCSLITSYRCFTQVISLRHLLYLAPPLFAHLYTTQKSCRPLAKHRPNAPLKEARLNVHFYILVAEDKQASLLIRFLANGKKSQIELEWAKRSMAHAEVYAKLLTDFDGAKLHLTQHDDAILASFKQEFPEIDVSDVLKGGDHFNSTEAKAKWTKWIAGWSSKITDAQYGSRTPSLLVF